MPHVPKPRRGSSVRNGLFRNAFRYDPDQDVDICPAGQTLSPNHEGKARDLKKIDDSNPALAPPVRGVRAARPICARSRVGRTRRCATAWQPLKARPEILARRRETVARRENEAVRDRMAASEGEARDSRPAA